jgi:F420H(2)-dependent quinone reductase
MRNWQVTDDRHRGIRARDGVGAGALRPMARWFYSRGGTYPGGRADARARRLARLWAAVIARGLLPKRWVTLEVVGRRSGRVTRFPLGMADWDGRWYLVPMLGERCNWVQNVRAADGRATLRGRRAGACRLVEVPVSQRPPIIKRYLQKVPGARPHIPVSRHAPVADFGTIAPHYPVFRIVRPCDTRRTRIAACPAATPVKENDK